MEGGGLLSVTDSPHLCNDQTTSLKTMSKSTSVDTFSILVVDDDITCLAIVAAILKKFNYEVVTVKHPNDALCTLRIKGGAFDLVVSDIHMPDMNGFELQQAIAREFDLPVVLMSADESEGVALKGLESGAAFFIMKPVNPDDLRDLWQFAALKKMENQSVNNKNNNNNIIIQEVSDNNKTSSENANVSDQVGVCESSSDAGMKTTESKRKSPRKEGSEEGDDVEKSQQKRPKIVWTNSLHNRFLEAIRSIGLDRAVPKKILEVMNVPGLTRENVASHLQKYRIFLRRVSDASYKIQYSSLNIPLKTSSCESSRDTTSPSTLMLNKYTTHPYQNLAPLSNREAPSSSRQSSLLSNRENWRNPSIENATLISRQHDHTRGAVHVRNNYVGPTFASQENVGTLGVATSSLSLKNPTYRSNYVGYKISDIQRITEKFINTGHNNGPDKTNPPAGQHQSNIEVALNDSASAGLSGNIRVDQSVPPIIPTAHSTENHHKIQLDFGGEVDRESGFSPMFDLSEFDFLSAQQALETTLANQNQSQQNNGDLGFNFYGDMANGDDGFNAPNSFDQPPNQVQVQNNQLNNSQGFASSSQLNEAVTLPNDEHQDLTNSMDFGSIALQQSMPIFSPIHERNDDDFLESLLAPFGDDHPFS